MYDNIQMNHFIATGLARKFREWALSDGARLPKADKIDCAYDFGVPGSELIVRLYVDWQDGNPATNKFCTMIEIWNRDNNAGISETTRGYAEADIAASVMKACNRYDEQIAQKRADKKQMSAVMRDGDVVMLDMDIKALGQEPCEDAISRDFQIGDEVRIIGSDPIYDDCDVGWVLRNESEKVYVMRNDGSVGEETKAAWYKTGRHNAMLAKVIKALEQEPCEDAVNRKDVLDMLFWKKVDMGDALYERLEDIAKRLHPVQTLRDIEVELYREKVVDAFERGVLHGKNLASVRPSRPTGHWIYTGWVYQTDETLYGYGCSECGGISFFRKSNNKILGGKWCHCCGMKMVDSRESEGTE